MFNEHPVFETPPESASLWRYMDFARFIALLERRALFFSSIRAFPDRFEGTLTPALLAQLEHMGEAQVRTCRVWRIASYVNCWNEDPHESVALWSMYTSAAGGVAIKSSIDSIRAALRPDDPVGNAVPTELYAGRVRYVEYATAAIPADNAWWPVVHKRTPYAFEHEVRLVLWPRPLVEEAQRVRGEDWTEVLGDLAPAGYDVGFDPAVLIEAVVVAPQAPDWLVDLVRAVVSRYGITGPVIRSDLDAEPV